MITGAAKRLGRASALRLAEAGADVAITYLNDKARRYVEPLAQAVEVLDEALAVAALTIKCWRKPMTIKYILAIAIITRCRMPPESWCGKSLRRSAGRGIPTSPRTSAARSFAARCDAPV